MTQLIIKPNDLTIEHITKAMLFHSGEPFATSTQIAKYFGIRHDNLIRKIESFHSFDELIGSSKLRSQNRTIRGKKYPFYEVDGDAFSFVCLSITGQKAEAFKWAFIRAYKRATAEALTARITADANRANQIWIETRTQGKLAHRSYTDAIKSFCLYAEEQRGGLYSVGKNGDPNNKPCPYYVHLQRIAYQQAGVEVNKGHLPKRDALSGAELERMESIEFYIAEPIEDLMLDGMGYKRIFKQVKSRLDNEMGNSL